MVKRDDFTKALELIGCSNKVLITSHIRPDGDSCGSVRGMYSAVENMDKEARPVFLSPVSNWYKFMFDREIPILNEDFSIDDLRNGDNGWDSIDLVIICDTNSYVQLPEFADWLREYKSKDGKVLVIDHHITNDGLGDVELVDVKAAACGEIVYDFIASAGIKITSQVAEALFVAIASDTGWFRFGNRDGRVYRTAAGLIDFGVNPAVVYQKLYQNFELPKLKLLARVLDGLELHLDGRVAFKTVMQEDFEKTNASPRDTEGIIEEGQKIGSVRAAAMFVEQTDGKFKVSLRSKGEINVREIAQKYSGGGHDFASGVMLELNLDEAKKLILDEMKKQFEQIPTIKQD